MSDINENTKGQEKVIGRNEPCPCGSGKKYKRCHGVAAEPKLTTPKNPGLPAAGFPGAAAGAGTGGFDPASLGMDPQMMMQMSQALQRLPRGQMQRLQAIMQKAMAGKDVSRESAEFEKTLPVEFQQMLRAFSGQMMPNMEAPQMTEEEARALVAKAADEGKISSEQAQELLTAQANESQPEAAPETSGQTPAPSKLSKFWKGFSGRKS